MRITVQALQDKLSRVAKQSLDRKVRLRIFLKRKYGDRSRGHGGSTSDYLLDWDYPSSAESCASTTTVADKRTGKVVGEPYRGKPDLRFDEGTKGSRPW